jgi:hypothetical protein
MMFGGIHIAVATTPKINFPSIIEVATAMQQNHHRYIQSKQKRKKKIEEGEEGDRVR